MTSPTSTAMHPWPELAQETAVLNAPEIAQTGVVTEAGTADEVAVPAAVEAEVAVVAAPDAEAAAVSAAVDTAAADATNQKNERWRDGRPRPSGRAKLGSLERLRQNRGLFLSTTHVEGRACPERSRRMSHLPSRPKLGSAQPPVPSVSLHHGQERNRIPKADRQVPDLDHRLHAPNVRFDRSLRVEGVLTPCGKESAGDERANRSG